MGGNWHKLCVKGWGEILRLEVGKWRRADWLEDGLQPVYLHSSHNTHASPICNASVHKNQPVVLWRWIFLRLAFKCSINILVAGQNNYRRGGNTLNLNGWSHHHRTLKTCVNFWPRVQIFTLPKCNFSGGTTTWVMAGYLATGSAKVCP